MRSFKHDPEKLQTFRTRCLRFKHDYAVRVEVAANLLSILAGKRAINPGYAVNRSRLGGAFLLAPAIGPLPYRAKIDDFSHARQLSPTKPPGPPHPCRPFTKSEREQV